MQVQKVWDPVVRLSHWAVAGGILLNGAILDEDSKWHETVGYVVMGVVVLRLLWGLVGSAHAKFSDFPPSAAGAMDQLSDIVTGRDAPHVGHTPLGALMIYNLWVSILAIGATGYAMGTDVYWGVAWVEGLHEALASWVYFSVFLHVGAVILETRRTKVNLPLSMITGRKSLPETKV